MITKKQVELISGTKEELLEYFNTFVYPKRCYFNVTDDGKIEHVISQDYKEGMKDEEYISQLNKKVGEGPIAYYIMTSNTKILSIKEQLDNLIRGIGQVFYIEQSVKDDYVKSELAQRNNQPGSIPGIDIKFISSFVKIINEEAKNNLIKEYRNNG